MMSEEVALKLRFKCQLAQGSATKIISNFANVRELYARIASAFHIHVDEILFCTLNTPRVDMSHLLGCQIGLDDFIFAHIKGPSKRVVITKNTEALGLTITDNGAGCCFIKRIKEQSLVHSYCDLIKIGDQIQAIDDESMENKRHFEVATRLRHIPRNRQFTITLIECSTSGFANLASPWNRHSVGRKEVESGRKTLRMGPKSAVIEEEASESLIENSINELLEQFFNIHDPELAHQLVEMAEKVRNIEDFVQIIEQSELGQLGFSDAFVCEVWQVIQAK